jgi:hypothetical protein
LAGLNTITELRSKCFLKSSLKPRSKCARSKTWEAQVPSEKHAGMRVYEEIAVCTAGQAAKLALRAQGAMTIGKPCRRVA